MLPANPTYADLMTEFDSYGQMRQAFAFDDVFEEVPLGVFVMTEVNVKEGLDGASMEIIGVDRSMRIARSLWVDPVGIVAGTTLSDAVGAVLSNRWPDVELDLQSTASTVPALTLGVQGGSSSNPWVDVQKIAEAGGLEVYFDNGGVAVLASVNDPSSQTPLETYVEGEDAMVLDVSRRLSTDQTHNGVVVTGEGTNVEPPVRAVLFDEDPASPTYRYGAFGERPVFVSSPLVLTTADAIAVAGAELSKMKGAEENVEWSQICDPSLDAGDVIKIRNEGTRLAKVLVLDKVSIPLSPGGSMKAVARTVRVLVEGE